MDSTACSICSLISLAAASFLATRSSLKPIAVLLSPGLSATEWDLSLRIDQATPGAHAAWGNRPTVPQELLEREPLRLRIAVDRLVLLRCDDDDVRLRAGDFVALFFVDVFLAVGFLADDARAGDFLAPLFRAEVFLLDGFFAGDLLLDDFLFLCLRSRARAVPPIAAPSTAAPVAASRGFSATAPTTFFAPDPTFLAPDPTTDEASPALSFMVEMAPRPFCSVLLIRSVAFAGVMCPPPSPVSRSRSP
jgi:hypothetical protein